MELTERGTSRYTQAGPIRVHYNEAGSGHPLIFTEGQGPGTSAWVVYHRVFPLLAKNYRCLLLDQPGYGKSDVVTVTTEARSTMYARTVVDFMNALNVEKASLVDMSFGAATALVVAIEHPERVHRLILHGSGLGGPTLFGHNPAEGITVMAETFENPTMETMRKMMNCFLWNGESFSDEDLMLRERLDAWLSRSDQQEARRSSKNVERDLTADLDKVTMPVLQISGRNDRLGGVERAMRLMNLLPDSRLMVFNHCGHWAPIQKPEEFARMVHLFLSEEHLSG